MLAQLMPRQGTTARTHFPRDVITMSGVWLLFEINMSWRSAELQVRIWIESNGKLQPTERVHLSRKMYSQSIRNRFSSNRVRGGAAECV